MDTTRLKLLLDVLSKVTDGFTCELVLKHSGQPDIVLDGSQQTPDIQAEFQHRLSVVAQQYIDRLREQLAAELSKPAVSQYLFDKLEEASK